MGKLLPTVYVTKKEDLLVSKDGPFSIITWRNRKPSSPAEALSKKAKAKAKAKAK